MGDCQYTGWEDRLLPRGQLKRGIAVGASGLFSLAALGYALQQTAFNSALGATLIALMFLSSGLFVSGGLDLYRIVCRPRLRTRLRFDANSVASEWEARGWKAPAGYEVPYERMSEASIWKGEISLFFMDHDRHWKNRKGELWFLDARLNAFPNRESFDRLIKSLTAHDVPIVYADDSLTAAEFGSDSSLSG